MKSKTFLLTLIVCLLGFTNAYAQKNKNKELSYNLQRATEYISQEEYDTAMEFVQSELNNDSKSVLAHELAGYIHIKQEKYGPALSSYNKALRYADKKDKATRTRLLYNRGRTNLNLEDTISAVADMEAALKLTKDDITVLGGLADLYFEINRYDESDALCNRMIAIDNGNAYPYLVLARTANNAGRDEDAKKYIAKARQLDPESSMPTTLEMRMAIRRHDHKAVIDKAIEVLDMDYFDIEAYHTLLVAIDSVPEYAVNSLKKKIIEDSEYKNYWSYFLAETYNGNENYDAALPIYESLLKEYDEMTSFIKPIITERLIRIHIMRDDYEDILGYCNLLISTFSGDDRHYMYRADANLALGNYEQAIEDYQTAAAESEYPSYNYNQLGWIDEIFEKYDDALEEYDKAILFDEEEPYYHYKRGRLLIRHLNRPEEGIAEMKRCIELDSLEKNLACLQYAYLALGDTIKAFELNDSLIAREPDHGSYYERACLFALVNDKENALKNLETSFEKGNKAFCHARVDDDLKILHNTPEFDQLLDKYENEEFIEFIVVPNKEEVVYEFPLIRQPGGTYLVKASINDLPMDFILDTGCSDISISKVESDFMLKSGYLKNTDFRGSQTYLNASGERHKSSVVNLRSVKIGDLEVNDIRAGIINNQDAPLLLGQAVLNRFGKVEIDTNRNMLKITVTE